MEVIHEHDDGLKTGTFDTIYSFTRINISNQYINIINSHPIILYCPLGLESVSCIKMFVTCFFV
jgi:hypothetical protein